MHSPFRRCAPAPLKGSLGICPIRGGMGRGANPSVTFGDSSPLRTETAFQAVPVFRMAYFPIPHRPTFGAPVFRSAYSASRNARASAAFAASIEAHCAVCRKTRMLQVRCARPAPSHRNVPSGRSGVTHGLFSVKSTSCSSLQNAHASGSLREPYGYRGAKLRVLMPPL